MSTDSRLIRSLRAVARHALALPTLVVCACGAASVTAVVINNNTTSTVQGPSRIEIVPHTSSVLPGTRTLRVFLPPGYDSTTTRRYPVMYFQPGANAFVGSRIATSSPVPWGIDTTLTSAIHAAQLPPMIVVAVDVGVPGAIDEYTPPPAFCFPGATPPTPAPLSNGDKYATMLATEIKPAMDARYRTLTAASSTFLMGSSVAARESFYAMMTYPNVFGNAALFSFVPCAGGGQLWNNLTLLAAKLPVRVYLAVGANEAAGVVSNAGLAHTAFTGKGWVVTQDINPLNVQVGGAHDETSWSKLVAPALSFLFH